MKRLVINFALLLIMLSAVAAGSQEAAFRTYFIVRHAEKADDGTKDPPLTLEGIARAGELAAMLKDAGISGFFASEYQRTQLTVKPLADLAGAEVTVVDAKDYDALIEKCRAVNGNVVIAGHSNTVPDIVKKLTGREFEIGHDEYDNLFVVVEYKSGDTDLIRLHFGKPTAVEYGDSH